LQFEFDPVGKIGAGDKFVLVSKDAAERFPVECDTGSNSAQCARQDKAFELRLQVLGRLRIDAAIADEGYVPARSDPLCIGWIA
jgi:hypothetical protein